MSTLSTPAPGSNNGVSYLAMKTQLDELMANMARQNDVIAQQAAAINARPAASGTATPAIPKAAAVPMNTQVWKPGQAIKLGGTPTAKVASSSGKPCGSKSPNGICQKCGYVDESGVFHGAPFHPVRHYSLEAVLRLDGSSEPITHETWKTAKFIGISVEGEYWGNVVFVGFGKDCLNFRPKNAVALAVALGGDKSPLAVHIRAVLTSSGGAHLLA